MIPPTGGNNHGLWLELTPATLTRAVAWTGRSPTIWQSYIAASIRFGVKHLRDASKRCIVGYVYGTATVGRSTTLFAFAAGMRNKTGANFWLGVSIHYQPEASIGVKPTKLISDA